MYRNIARIPVGYALEIKNHDAHEFYADQMSLGGYPVIHSFDTIEGHYLVFEHVLSNDERFTKLGIMSPETFHQVYEFQDLPYEDRPTPMCYRIK